MLFILHLLFILIMPVIMVGVINRTKALWAGRKGFPILQLFYDLQRLFRKQPVFSSSSSWIFQLSGTVFLCTTFLAALIVPVVPGYSPISFQYDFLFFAYLLAFGRISLILGGMDTGSSFEGMGASREAAFSSLVEPAFFISMGALCLISTTTSLSSFASAVANFNESHIPILLLCAVALFIFIQIESARVPVDDPNTHLELTMIHEVMVLDHSGPDLAFIQYASGLKMTILASLIVSLVNTYSVQSTPLESIATSVGMLILIAIVIGLIESLVARMRLKLIPVYLSLAFTASFGALILALTKGWIEK